MKRLLFLIPLCVLVLSACGAGTTATPTVAPTATPTPVVPPPTRDQVDQLAGQLNNVTVTSYDQSTGTLVVQVDYGTLTPTQALTKGGLTNMQSRFWQSYTFSQVTANAVSRGSKIAYAVLKRATASKLNFNPPSAALWDQFDEKWVDPTLSAI